MSKTEEDKKNDLIKEAIALEIFSKEQKIDNLTNSQLEELIKKWKDLKNKNHKAFVDELCKNKKIEEKVQEELKAAVVKSRKENQNLKKFKETIKSQAKNLVELLS